MSEPTHEPVERAVLDRYSSAANDREAELCCPVSYDAKYLEIIPQEILERDYGCGDPSRYVHPGETVLDLGSGGGKICYIASQIVGAQGRVIGVDMNDDMLGLAERYRGEIAGNLGYDNVQFHKGKIQDLSLDYGCVKHHLQSHPIRDVADLQAFEEWKQRTRTSQPMIADGSVDVIVSNCVLNLVRLEDRRQLFSEMHRVLRRGGRATISDIVSDEDIPQSMQDNPKLWSGCISGAFREDHFLDAFAEAGFYGMRIVERGETPWQVIDGIEFRSVTVEAFRGKEGPCMDHNQAVIYTGPWRSVTDDDGHTLYRGQRMAVCEKTHAIYTRPPYAGQIVSVPPCEAVPVEDAPEFDCRRNAIRDPKETKGRDYDETRFNDEPCCGPETDCC